MAYPHLRSQWPQDELAAFAVSAKDQQWLDSLYGSRTKANRLGLAVLLKTYLYLGYAPRRKSDIQPSLVDYIAESVGIEAGHFGQYEWKGRVWKRHLRAVRQHCEFSAPTPHDEDLLRHWLVKRGSEFASRSNMFAAAITRCRSLHLELPTEPELQRLVSSAWRQYLTSAYQTIAARLPASTKKRMNECLLSVESPTSDFDWIKSAARGKGNKTSRQEVAKLRWLLELQLKPETHLAGYPVEVLRDFRDRVRMEEASKVRRHAPDIRYTLLACYFHFRRQEVTDGLVELFLELIHNVEKKADKTLEKEVVSNIRQLHGKGLMLYKMAVASRRRPRGKVCDVIFPEVGENTLDRIIEDWEQRGNVGDFDVTRAKTMRKKYAFSCRGDLKPILDTLVFRSNSQSYKPLLHAIDLVRRYWSTNHTYYPSNESVPVELIKGEWQELTLEGAPTERRVLKQYFEMCVLLRLEKALRCKEVWVEGSFKYRNPDEDLPDDWTERREEYYQRRNLPLDARVLIEAVKQDVEAALKRFDEFLAQPQDVSIRRPGGGKRAVFHVPPIPPRPEPPLIQEIKKLVVKKWGILDLLDILIEADRRVNFAQFFHTSGQRQVLSRDELRERLLLTLFSLGTNIGLKRIHAAARPSVSYQELLYFRNRYMRPQSVREAIAALSNVVLEARNPDIWGNGTACASDGKQLGAWDQNLMTEWNPHYRSSGVMIYWHVDKKSLCIYSKRKTCSSSEVAAMIEGVLRHETEMTVEKNFVDSHGQSEVGFAFCRLLNFDLLPRLKRVKYEKLYLPDKGMVHDFPHLAGVLARPIRWDLIERQYDDIVRHVVAVAENTGPIDSILRRFNKYNRRHPTYKAFIELGKAVKTIFLCRYLSDPALRLEIHEGLNVVENWNSCVEFIFYGRKMEFHTNDPERQELAALCLHLLQNTLILVNTVMVERVLNEHDLLQRMGDDDRRGITPLFTSGTNPYGAFDLDLHKPSFLEAA